MGRLIVYFGLLASLCASCAPCCRDTTLFKGSGRQKAIVTVLPVIDHTEGVELTWDISREFTDEIRKRVYESSNLYLLRDHGTREIAEKLNTPNPAMISSAMVQDMGATEFIVVSELLEQNEIPFGGRLAADDQQRSEPGCILNLAMRIRVLDIRHDKPKVILQEVVNHEQFIPRIFLTGDYCKAQWGTDAFNRTPLGIAHHKLVKEAVSRVENYIEAAR